VEIASPLLVRGIAELTRTHPDHLRTGKRIFREVATEKHIPVEFAHARAIAEPEAALRYPSMTAVLRDELHSARLRDALSPAFAAYVAGKLPADTVTRRVPRTKRLRRIIKGLLPEKLRARLTRISYRQPLSAHRLALRGYLISRMNERLGRDARALT